jgi:hypothetical protein
MKQTFAKQIHLPVEIKNDLKKMCIDLGTDPKNFIQDMVIEEVKNYQKQKKINNI